MKKFIFILAFILPFCFSLKGFCYSPVDYYFDSSDYGSVLLVKGGDTTYLFYTFTDDVLSLNCNVISSANRSPYGYRVNNGTTIGNILYGSTIGIKEPVEVLRYKNVTGVPTSEFDDSITLGRFFYNRVDFLGVPLSDKYYIWWGLGNAAKVKIEYYNILSQDVYTSFERTNSLVLQYSVFNPSDYNISDNTYVGVRITPYDSSGNYGSTDSLGFIAHSDIIVSEHWSDSPYIEPVLNVNGLDDVRPYINKYTVTTTIPNMPTVPKEQYSPNYIVDVDTTEIERLLQYIIDNMNNNVSDEPQQIIINTPVTYDPVETDFDTPTFKNDFKNWKNGIVDYLMQFNGTPFGDPFAHLVTVILILSGLALALLIIKRL